ncbi:SKP1-like protein 1B [Prosopis cineraria]|uniref:SKP1-like protein 1B n=1 Tax=Prosopis cineraria TaxID=364024 RepID=UPI00240F1EFA|nr:SKP1-like protein 1B [Prosopis cineraria]
MTTTPSSEKLTLESNDGTLLEIDVKIALTWQLLKNKIDDGCVDGVIPIENVNGETLAKVIEYCQKHAMAADDAELRRWDAEFLNVDWSSLFDLTLAADYLQIKSLRDLTIRTVSDRIVEIKSPEEFRRTFGIKNDFSPEEEAQIRKENQWAFDGYL